MAQREDKKTEIHAHETLTLVLCANNCGLFGNPATNNMCQSCFQRSSHPQSCSPRSAPQATPSPDPSKPAEEAEIQQDAAASPAEAPAAVARKVSRCLVCRKRVGLTGFRCRCGDLFCGEHRYSDRHACSFDYKTAARAAIARDNPVVRAAKIVRV